MYLKEIDPYTLQFYQSTMTSNFTPPASKSFGQHVSLIPRIRRLVHDYPEGIGIIKELIQNADDAGAKKIEIIFDWRSPEHKWDIFAGPSMLIFNDAIFTDEDFDGIQKIDEGGKKDSLRKTGRFGVGFNSVYNLTDYPSFISSNYLCWFDPLRTYAEGSEPGGRWLLKDLIEQDFMKTYEVGGFECGTEFFQGTLFRLPFRTTTQAEASGICNSPSTRKDNAEPLLKSVSDIGEELLLFLKSIVEIKIREIETDGSEKVRLHIKTVNTHDVSQERKKLMDVVERNQESFIQLCQQNSQQLPRVSYLHEIQTITPKNTFKSIWRVVHVMRVDPHGQLIDCMEKFKEMGEKAVPWGGAALRIQSDSHISVIGKQYCFLPIPETTDWPIHVHGYFDLNSSRQASIEKGNTGTAAIRSLWNELIVNQVIASACVQLVADVVWDIGENDPLAFYELWPIKTGKLDLFKEFPSHFVKALRKFPVFRSNLEKKWVRQEDVSVLNPEWTDFLMAPLTAAQFCLPEPAIPKTILDIFDKANLSFKKVTPKMVREHLYSIDEVLGVSLSEVSHPSLRNKQWIQMLLQYILSDGHKDLRGIPLALLADGNLQRFGENPPGWIYLANDLEKKLFKHCPNWFLDADLESIIVTHFPINGVEKLTPEGVAERLLNLDCWTGELPQPWKPDGDSLPNASWLSLIYQYFTSTTSLPIPTLRELPIVPGNDKKLHRGGACETPLWLGHKLSSKEEKMLDFFGIPLVSDKEVNRGIFESYFERHSLPNNRLIYPLTGNDLIDTLNASKDNLPVYNDIYYNDLLPYLSRELLKLDNDHINTLKELPILPTRNHDLVSANDDSVYFVEETIDPPNVPLNIKLIEKTDHLEILLKTLGLKSLNLPTLIEEVLSEYEGWQLSDQITALEWLREHFNPAIEQLRRKGREYRKLEKIIANTPLIYCSDGRLRSPNKTYHPEEQIVKDVLGGDAPIPDMNSAYATDKGLWLKFFENIGILRHPDPQDLLDHTERLLKKSQETSVKKVAEACRTLLFYIEDNWDKLKNTTVLAGNNQKMKLPDALRSKQWLPVLTDEKELGKYPGAINLIHNKSVRLYRPDEVILVQEGNLAASQRPLLRLKRSLKRDVAEGLGFKQVTTDEVIKHFDYLLDLWINTPDRVKQITFEKALIAVYSYFEKTFIVGKVDLDDKRRFQKRFANRLCLWDFQGNFWKPNHIFNVDISYYGKRRIGLGKHKFKEVYQILGQRNQPTLEDHLAFIADVYKDYGDKPITDIEDIDCIVQVLNRINKRLEDRSEQGFRLDYILTEDNCLVPPEQVIIPDAPWYVNAVRKNAKVKLLHPNIDRGLADRVGCPSLLRNVKAIPIDEGISLYNTPEAIEKAQKWQLLLNSKEFQLGLERILRHEGVIQDEANFSTEWLINVDVISAKKISKNLSFKNQIIAELVEGDSYFNSQNHTFYIRYDSLVGTDYLADCLNQQLAQQGYDLQDKSKLVRILNEEPEDIEKILDKLRVRSSKKKLQEIQDESEKELPPIDIHDPKNDFDEETSHPSFEHKTARKHCPFIVKNADEDIPINNQNSDSNGAKAEKGERKYQRMPINTSERQDDRNIEASEKERAYQRSGKNEQKGTSKRSSSRTSDNSEHDKQKHKSDKRNVAKSQSMYGCRPSSKFSGRVDAEHEESLNDTSETLLPDHRRSVEALGIEKVLAYEVEQGRNAKFIEGNNSGYDIESFESDGSIRYIEVKTFTQDWPHLGGAKLSIAQFRKAQDEKDSFWLYVVESVEANPQIYCIQNPVEHIKEFYFDSGWRDLAN